jgi:inner membrane protein
MPPILAGLLWLLDRWQLRNRTEFRSGLPMHFGWLIGLCYLGAITHPYLDLLTTYSVQLFSPLSARWYHADGLFIIDIWIWLVLALGIGLSKSREKKGSSWRWPAQIAVATVLAYIGANLSITWVAHQKLSVCSACGGPPQQVFASPPPVEFWKRDLVWRDGQCYRRGSFDMVRDSFGPVSACKPTNMNNSVVREAIRRDPRLQKFLKWSILPQADVVLDGCSARVTIGDARYGEGRRSRLARETVVPLCGGNLDNLR